MKTIAIIATGGTIAGTGKDGKTVAYHAGEIGVEEIINSINMNIELLLDVVIDAGKMLMESGAEVYRVEETTIRLCESYKDVTVAESYVTATGIMISIKYNNQTHTRIGRIHSRGTNLEIVHQINDLSRSVKDEQLTVEELNQKLQTIKHVKKYSLLVTTLFGGIGAAGFAMFFDGNKYEILACFMIGLLVRLCVSYCSHMKIHSFIGNTISSGLVVGLSYLSHLYVPHTDMNKLIISCIMLLVPGLAITNAIRDTMTGDYLSGLARAAEAFIVSAAIAIGAVVVLSWVV